MNTEAIRESREEECRIRKAEKEPSVRSQTNTHAVHAAPSALCLVGINPFLKHIYLQNLKRIMVCDGMCGVSVDVLMRKKML